MNRTDSALYIQVNRRILMSVGIIHIPAIMFLQAAGMDISNSALNIGLHAYRFRKVYGRLPYTAVHVYRIVLLGGATKVHLQFSDPHLHAYSPQSELSQIHPAFACAKIDL